MKINIHHNHFGSVPSAVISIAERFDGHYDTDELSSQIAKIRTEVEADSVALELTTDAEILRECVQRIVTREFEAAAGQATGANAMCFSAV